MSTNATAPPPPPMDPSKLPHDSKQPDIIACIVTTWTIALLAVAARFYTRLRISEANLGASEYCLLAALLASFATSVCQVMQVQFGSGAHIWDLTPANSDPVKGVRALWISIIFYTMCLHLCKISILLLFLNIFVQRWTRIAVYIVLGIMAVAVVWTFYVIFSACAPIQAYWDTTIQGATCHPQSFWLSNSGLLIATDFLVFFLPIPVVWRLKMRVTQKLMVLALFSMGFFVCIVSIIRIAVLQPVLLDGGPDATYNTAPILYWTGVEMNGSVVVAACITLRPLFARLMPRLLTPRSHHNNKSKRTGASEDAWHDGPHKTLVTIGSSRGGGPNGSGSLQDDAIHVENRFSAEVNSDEDDLELGDLQRRYRAPFPPRVRQDV